MHTAHAADETAPSTAIERHLAPAARGLGRSATLAINERCAHRRAAGEPTYRLGLGQSPFPVPAAVVDALRQCADEKDYLPVQGLGALREAVVSYHRRRHGIARDAEDVIVGPGSKELMFLLQLVYAGELLLPSPSWVSYAPQARLAGRSVRWLETDPQNGWRLDPDTLERACAAPSQTPRLLILNYPSNPTGQSYTPNQLAALARVARRHNILVLSDEIYGELHHDDAHHTLAEHYPEGTIVSAGLSKWCGAGGWRLGTFCFPRELAPLSEAVACAASETYTTASAPIQHAAVRAFEGGAAIDAYLADSRRLLAALGRWIAGRLREAGAAVDDPEGGFYLFPDFTPIKPVLARAGIADSERLCARLLADTGVAMLPGTCFGRPGQELTARLAYVAFEGGAALDALDAGATPDEAFLRRHMPEVTDAIDATCRWLRSHEDGQ